MPVQNWIGNAVKPVFENAAHDKYGYKNTNSLVPYVFMDGGGLCMLLNFKY